MNLFSEAIEATEAHKQGTPFIGIDMVVGARHNQAFLNVSPHNANFKGPAARVSTRSMAKWVCIFKDRFQMHGTLENSLRLNYRGLNPCKSSGSEFVWLMAISHRLFMRGHRISSGQLRESIDCSYQLRRWQIDDAFALAKEIFSGLRTCTQA